MPHQMSFDEENVASDLSIDLTLNTYFRIQFNQIPHDKPFGELVKIDYFFFGLYIYIQSK